MIELRETHHSMANRGMRRVAFGVSLAALLHTSGWRHDNCELNATSRLPPLTADADKRCNSLSAETRSNCVQHSLFSLSTLFTRCALSIINVMTRPHRPIVVRARSYSYSDAVGRSELES